MIVMMNKLSWHMLEGNDREHHLLSIGVKILMMKYPLEGKLHLKHLKRMMMVS